MNEIVNCYYMTTMTTRTYTLRINSVSTLINKFNMILQKFEFFFQHFQQLYLLIEILFVVYGVTNDFSNSKFNEWI